MSFRAEPSTDLRGGLAGSGLAGSGAAGSGAAGEASLLPLRLSVVRGGLSIELTRPHVVPGLVVEALEVELDGVGFPIDLSRGVKQFRHRRGRLRHLAVRLDLQALARQLEASVTDILGEPALGLRLIPAPLTDGSSGLGPGGAPQADNDARAPALGLVAVSIFGQTSALAFDLVLAPGSPPSFIVDGARGVALREPALATVLALLDRGLASGPLGFVRRGRTVELSGLVRALLAEVLPSLGFRTPKVEGHVVHRAVFGPEGISLHITADDEPCPVGARAVRLAGLSTFTRTADDRLAQLDLEGARAELLTVLEQVPGHPEVLLNLAELDAHVPLRSESALAFLAESERGNGQQGSRNQLTLHQALARGLRRELAVEALEQAVEVETDGTIAALCHCLIAEASGDTSTALRALDRAVSRAPSHPQPRWRRLELNLRAGTLTKALVDAEQLEALATPGMIRARVTHEVGRLLAGQGHGQEAVIWLRRALTQDPDQPRILLDLATALAGAGENLRAAELYQMALARAEERKQDDGDLDSARVALGRLLAETTGDLHLALGYVRRVGARAKQGLEARELEITLARRLGDVAALRSATLRLIQALELGWIASGGARALLESVSSALRALGQDDLADHAARAAGSGSAGSGSAGSE